MKCYINGESERERESNTITLKVQYIAIKKTFIYRISSYILGIEFQKQIFTYNNST